MVFYWTRFQAIIAQGYQHLIIHTYPSITQSASLFSKTWWRHQMETFSALLALCAGNSSVPVNSLHKGQWRGALIFFFHLHLNKWLSKQPRGWWFETPAWSFWRQCNVFITDSGIILHMRPANERRRYVVTSSLIGWVHTQNDPCRFPIAPQGHHMSVMTLEITKNMPVCSSAYPG